jgi:tetratricopeptide (TPR) repeat protein
VAKRGTTNEEAYRLYLQGVNLTAKRNQADAQRAIEYFEQAIRLDPNFALAYAGMAYAYSASGTLDRARPREAYEKAREAIDIAAELDPNLADVYAVRGELRLKYEWDLAGAEKDLRSAIEMEPNNDLAREVYALWLNHQGRFDEALAEIEIALAIDPNSLVHQRERGRFLYFARRYDEAIVHLERVLEIDENFNTAFHWLILAYEKKGDYAGAFKWIMTQQKQRNPESVEMFQKAYEAGGWHGVKRKTLEFETLNEPTAGNFYRLASHHARLNEKQQAFEYLNKALDEQQTAMNMLKVEPAFDSLRDDPRFDELLRRVGFK